MSTTKTTVLLVSAYLFFAGAAAQSPPVARVIAHVDTLHGDIRVDNYHWLREKTNPEVIAYLNSSGRYERLHEIAFKYAFMLDAVGMANATP